MAGFRLGLLGLLLLGSGCYGPPPEAVARLKQLEADEKEMNASLDAMEDRLLGNQATLQLWAELGRRHKQVSAIAVVNHSEHYDAMVRSLDAQQEKARKLRRMRGDNVAAADEVLSNAVATNATPAPTHKRARRAATP